MRPVHRQRGLAHPGRARHDDRVPAVHDRVERGQLTAPPGERPRRSRQLPRYRPGDIGDRQRGVRDQDLLVQQPQGGPRIGAELVGQPHPHLVVPQQRVGLASRPVQRQHQLPGQPFVPRQQGRHRLQLGQHLRVPPLLQHQVVAVQQSRHPACLQRGPHTGQPRSVQSGERLAAPQPQRLGEQHNRPFRLRPRPLHQVVEPVQVHR